MRRYTCEPNLQVSGVTLDSMVRNLEAEMIEPVIAEHGLATIKHDEWYPLQIVFDAFNDMMKRYNNTQLFVAMGMKIAEQSEFPPELQGQVTLPMMLIGWQEHYEANHRGGTLPPVETIQIADNHYQLVLQANHLYPFNLVYGMVYGFCRLLLPEGTYFVVEYDDVHTPYGDYGDKVIINITWEQEG